MEYEDIDKIFEMIKVISKFSLQKNCKVAEILNGDVYIAFDNVDKILSKKEFILYW